MNDLFTAVRSINMAGVIRMWHRNYRIFRKVFWIATAPLMIEPLIYLFSLGVGLGLFVQDIEGMSYIQYIAPGLLASTLMFAASFETTYDSFVRMKFGRIYEAVLATPLSIEDIIGGEILWGATRGYISALVYLGVIALFGLAPSFTVLLLLPLLFIFSLFFAVVGMIYTAYVSNIQLFNYYFTLFITPLFLFSGIFFPISALPAWAQSIAAFTPLYHIVLVCRGLAVGELSRQVLTSNLLVTISTALLLFFPIVLMKKRLIK
ncbi:MAG: ABC transporter permease [Rubrobacteridae bacterium]|nr:ABC transporter permease [Rubrobacteridae bacterium]